MKEIGITAEEAAKNLTDYSKALNAAIKKEEVLKELGSIAKALNIVIDYVVEDTREYLVCDKTKICTNGTSIHGIREEFFGYVFLLEWKHRYLGAFDQQTRRYIKQFWYDDNFKQPYLRGAK